MKPLFLFFLLSISFSGIAQFAPQYPLPGNEAIAATDPRISGWATGAVLERGWMNIADTALGKTSVGSAEHALGPAGYTVVSLGDGGRITLSFDAPITDGPGPDFAVFENAFPDPLNDTLAFLEFAFVEVSTEGERFVRFPAVSYIPLDSQRHTNSYIDASLVHNLAGKYIQGKGTPFDLAELADSPGIDINEINFIRIVDVVGSLDPKYASYDINGNIINDPWPTDFPQGGFDLDAVAVLNSLSSAGDDAQRVPHITIYPNPCTDILCIELHSGSSIDVEYSLINLQGRQVLTGRLTELATRLDLSSFARGLYLLNVGSYHTKVILH